MEYPLQFGRFTVEGTKGSLYGRIENDYKFTRIEYYSKDQPDAWIRLSPTGDWFPDAFYGTIFKLMNAINEDREPSISGEDNFKSLQLLHVIIKSAEENKVVRLDGFT